MRRSIEASAVVSLVTLLNAFAYAALLATGRLASLLPTILVSLLLATAIVSLVLTWLHTSRSALGGPSGNAAGVVGATLAAVAAADAGMAARTADVAIVLALSALLPGLVMLALWRLRLGRAIRFVPYPVLAGFLAGSGWLLVSGSARIADAPGPLAATAVFLVLLRLAQQRWKTPLLLPLGAACATLVTYAGLALAHVPLPAARSAHWLFARLPAAGPSLVTPAALGHANWGAIAGAWSAFAWVIIVVALVSMMNGAALELESGTDTNVDRDVAALGWANVAAGVGGGCGSQLGLPMSIFSVKTVPGSHTPAYAVAGSCVIAMFAASAIVPYVPKPVLAGIIALLGLRFLEQYVLAGWRTMPPLDVVAVIAMLVCTAVAGLQAALVLGLLVACIAFITDAGRQHVIGSRVTLRTARSRVERTLGERRLLDRDGDGVDILRLQGQLFFGSANALYESLVPIVDTDPARSAIVLDFAGVHGIDLSAALSLQKLVRRARRRGTAIVFVNAAAANERVLRRSGVLAAGETIYAHLDEALETCEAALLTRDFAAQTARSDDLGAGLRHYFQAVELPSGATLFTDGADADALYVLVRGRLSVERNGVHLRTLVPGALVGEMGFFTGDTRSATVMALEDAALQRLSHDALDRIERDEPRLLLTLQRSIVQLQADRLRSANAETIAFHA